MKKIYLFILFLAVISTFTVDAQVMWNLKGGIMRRSFNDRNSIKNDNKQKRIDWMAGLELEIPLSNRLNLETGLRYKNHYSLVHEYNNYYKTTTTHLELPLRLAYKQPLGKHFSLHAGAGPYVSCATGDGFKDGNLVPQVGIEPSIAINWACLSLGATYNFPCFYEGYKDENKPAVMVTLGIRFKSHVWKYVGAGLLAVATVGAAAAAVWPTNDGYSSYSSGSYSPSYTNDSYNSSSSGSNDAEMYRHWERRAQEAYNSLAGHSVSSSTYQANMRLLRDAQRNMAKYREKARRAGITINVSEWETKTVKLY